MSFVGSYRFASRDAIDRVLLELREVLEDPEPPTVFTIAGTEVTFQFSAACPSTWFDHFETITEAFAAAATSGSVEVTCEDETYSIEAGE